MKSQPIEMLLRDLLRITTREAHRLSEILANNFDLFDEQIVKILREEYQKPKNDWKVIRGCLSVIWKASQKYPRIGSKTFRNSYPLINRGLLDRRVSVKRLAALSVLNIICKIYFEQLIHINEGNNKEISAEITELKKKIKSADFLESFNLMFPSKLDKRTSCESAGIKAELLVVVSKSMLG
jgi:hypothetical protein